MPKKIIELTLEIEIQSVTCPGVWLCSDGKVSLTVFTLGTSYQTCRLPPVFPLLFKDVFFFKKRFQKICALNDMHQLLDGESIYCELVQWPSTCAKGAVLAQYLGTLNEMLFPPNMCSNEGVDLLMRTSKSFPGILSPKIEVVTKVRIDEVFDSVDSSDRCSNKSYNKVHKKSQKKSPNLKRQKPVCHTPEFHRKMCTKPNVCNNKLHKFAVCDCTRHSSNGATQTRVLNEVDTLNIVSDIGSDGNIDNTTISEIRNETRTNQTPVAFAHCDQRPNFLQCKKKLNDFCSNFSRDVTQEDRLTDTSTEEHRSSLHRTGSPLTTSMDTNRSVITSLYQRERNRIYNTPDVKCSRPYRKLVDPIPCVCEVCKLYHLHFHGGNNFM